MCFDFELGFSRINLNAKNQGFSEIQINTKVLNVIKEEFELVNRFPHQNSQSFLIIIINIISCNI